MVEWALGIFTKMGVMATIIGIIVATRFLYVDTHYSEIINQYKIKIQELEQKRREQESFDDDDETFKVFISDLYQEVGLYKSKRENNKREGLTIDFISLGFILVLGLLASVGFFAGNVTLLALSLGALFLMPLIHFLRHATTIQKAMLI